MPKRPNKSQQTNSFVGCQKLSLEIEEKSLLSNISLRLSLYDSCPRWRIRKWKIISRTLPLARLATKSSTYNRSSSF